MKKEIAVINQVHASLGEQKAAVLLYTEFRKFVKLGALDKNKILYHNLR
jgi:hypothetical protein